jgi:Holliday junction resolvase RusA-like endonuclease
MRPTVEIPVSPVPKPRMTQSDRWKKRPAVVRYHQFKDDLRALVRGSLDPRFDIVFLVPMPPSWSAKKRADMKGRPHQQKPDIDNYLKAFMDAMLIEDSHIYDTHPRKYWWDEGKIILTERGEDPNERYRE